CPRSGRLATPLDEVELDLVLDERLERLGGELLPCTAAGNRVARKGVELARVARRHQHAEVLARCRAAVLRVPGQLVRCEYPHASFLSMNAPSPSWRRVSSSWIPCPARLMR